MVFRGHNNTHSTRSDLQWEIRNGPAGAAALAEEVVSLNHASEARDSLGKDGTAFQTSEISKHGSCSDSVDLQSSGVTIHRLLYGVLVFSVGGGPGAGD